MSDTPRTDAMASEVEHLGPGGRALYQGRLWSLAYALEAELTATRAECDALRAECDALRADAERYRWLRSDVATAENYPIACMRDGGWLLLGDELDAAIAAAREAGK